SAWPLFTASSTPSTPFAPVTVNGTPARRASSAVIAAAGPRTSLDTGSTNACTGLVAMSAARSVPGGARSAARSAAAPAMGAVRAASTSAASFSTIGLQGGATIFCKFPIWNLLPGVTFQNHDRAKMGVDHDGVIAGQRADHLPGDHPHSLSGE